MTSPASGQSTFVRAPRTVSLRGRLLALTLTILGPALVAAAILLVSAYAHWSGPLLHKPFSAASLCGQIAAAAGQASATVCASDRRDRSHRRAPRS